MRPLFRRWHPLRMLTPETLEFIAKIAAALAIAAAAIWMTTQ
ncbi:MAG: hypothetical protein VX529_10400 [Pseudomonadota bacterium]|nr:hypothetical protein [Pseudomonadota bacterium]